MAAIRIKLPGKPLLAGGHAQVKSKAFDTASPISIAPKKAVWAPLKANAKAPANTAADPAMNQALSSLMHLLEEHTVDSNRSMSDIARPTANIRRYAAELVPLAQLRKLEAAAAQFAKALPANAGKEVPALDTQYAALKEAIRVFEDAITVKVENSSSLDVTSRARLAQVARELDDLESNAASLARKTVNGDPAGSALVKLVSPSSADVAALSAQLSSQASSLHAPLARLGLDAEATKLSKAVGSFSSARNAAHRSLSFDGLIGHMAEVEHGLVVRLRQRSLTPEDKTFASSVAVQLGVMHDAAAHIAGRVAELRPGSVLLEQLAARRS